MFSGLTVSQHGVHFGEGSQFWTPPVDGIDWLPAQLAARGYDTLAIASNPLSLPADDLGFARRFQPDRKTWHGNDTIAVSVDDNLELPVISRWSAWLRWRDPHVTADGVIAIARRALRRAPTSPPLFLFLNFMDAHGPYNPTPAALNALGLEEVSAAHRYRLPARIGKQQLPPRDIADLSDLYDGELRSLDRHLGPFIEEIVARLGTETVVVVTADHGEELGEEGRYDHLYGVVQRLVHVPLIVRDPRLPSGRRPELTSTKNLYRYLLGVADGHHDLDSLANADGDDVISERYPSGRYQRQLGSEYGRPWVALFAGTLKAIGPSSAGRELYRLDSRYARERRLVESPTTAGLFERLDRYWEEQRDRRGSSGQEHDREELERLRALGYID
jgi:arylsulfatase A-like enzyme